MSIFMLLGLLTLTAVSGGLGWWLAGRHGSHREQALLCEVASLKNAIEQAHTKQATCEQRCRSVLHALANTAVLEMRRHHGWSK